MKKRYLTLLALLLTTGLVAPACGGDDDDDNTAEDDDDDDKAGNGGVSGSGTSGNGGNKSGSGGSGNKAGNGGGGKGGGGGGGNVQPLEDEYTFTGGDIDADRQLFPFSAVASKDGSLFVSTLGNRLDEPSRIYRFNPGQSNAPEVLFQVGDGDDAAVYGLAIDNQDRLYACIAQHLQSAGGGDITASIYRFEANQIKQTKLGPGQVQQNALASNAIFNNGTYLINNAEVQAEACGMIAHDGGSNVYAADTSGVTQTIFRFNTEGNTASATGDNGAVVQANELQDLIMTAWFNDAQLGAGQNFATAGITIDGSSVKFIRDDDPDNLFDVTVRNGGAAEDNVGNVTINSAFNTPGGLVVAGVNRFIVSAVDTDELIELTLDDDAFNTNTLFDNDDDNSFIAPTGVAVRGNDIIVVGGQILDLGQVDTQQAFKVYRVDLN